MMLSMKNGVSLMNAYAALLLATCGLVSTAQAGTGNGAVVDVTIRTQDNLLVVKVANHIAMPGCVLTYGTFAKPYDGSASSKALLALMLSAQATGKLVRISGSGSCLTGTVFEEIVEANVGQWQ